MLVERFFGLSLQLLEKVYPTRVVVKPAIKPFKVTVQIVILHLLVYVLNKLLALLLDLAIVHINQVGSGFISLGFQLVLFLLVSLHVLFMQQGLEHV
jgi:hypothetical protein